MRKEPEWIERDAILLKHAELLRIGGAEGVRNEDGLEWALMRPVNAWADGGETRLSHLAAAYAFGIAKNHPFVDGNKRAAFIAFAGVKTARLVLIVALGRNRVIGRGNALPWRLGTDLRRFKALTLGKPVIMGRKTFASLGKPLPGRTNIVVTRDRAFAAPDGVLAASGIDGAVATARIVADADEADAVIVAGGAEIYAATLPLADILHLTEVDAEPEGDAYFPAFDPADFVETFSEHHPAGPRDDHAFRFVDYARRKP